MPDISHNVSGVLAATANTRYNVSAFLHQPGNIIPTGPFAIVPEGILCNYHVLLPQGTSSMAASDSGNILSAWICDCGLPDCGTAPGKHILCRLDTSSYVPIKATTNLSPVNGWSSVKVCFNPATGGWVSVFAQNRIIKFSIFDCDMNPIVSDETITLSGPNINIAGPNHFDIGCTNCGKLVVLYDGNLCIINTDTLQQIYFPTNYTNPSGPNRMLVSRTTGNIIVVYPDSIGLLIDEYNINVGILSSGTRLLSGYPGIENIGITSSHNSDVFLYAFWLSGTVYYQIIQSRVPATPVISLSQFQTPDSFYVIATERSSLPRSSLAYVIKIGDGSSVKLIHLKSDINNPSSVVGINELNVRSSSGMAIAGPDEFSIWQLTTAANDSHPPVLMDIYETESVFMDEWRIEIPGRIFSVSPWDDVAANMVAQHYAITPLGNKLAGRANTSISTYLSQPGRNLVDVYGANFSSFFGNLNEDTVFIGGPVMSEISRVMHDNNNVFDAQITATSQAHGVESLGFVAFPWQWGFNLGDSAPSIAVTNDNGFFTLKRHQAADQIKDYGIICRVPFALGQTQANKTFKYLAGINYWSTLACAYAYTRPLEYRLGRSLLMLCVITYPVDVTEYIPGVTGLIETFELRSVDSDDFVG